MTHRPRRCSCARDAARISCARDEHRSDATARARCGSLAVICCVRGGERERGARPLARAALLTRARRPHRRAGLFAGAGASLLAPSRTPQAARMPVPLLSLTPRCALQRACSALRVFGGGSGAGGGARDWWRCARLLPRVLPQGGGDAGPACLLRRCAVGGHLRRRQRQGPHAWRLRARQRPLAGALAGLRHPHGLCDSMCVHALLVCVLARGCIGGADGYALQTR